MKATRRAPESWDARSAAFRILWRVEAAGALADILLDGAESRLDDPRDASLLHEIVLGVLRRRAVLDHVLSRAASRSLQRIDDSVLTALRIGVYGLLFLDRVPDFAAVDSAVTIAKREGPCGAAGFVNAVLRRVSREGQALLPPPPEPGNVPSLAVFHSHPEWWARRIVDRWGWQAALRWLDANNRPAPTTLHPHLGRTTPRDLASRLAAEGVKTAPGHLVPEALRVISGVPQKTRTFREGYAWVQDEASQLVVRLFGRVLKPHVADLCAAPGGKALQLAECLPERGWIVAADRQLGRLRRLRENVDRLGVRSILPLVADMAAERAPVRGPFDHVLVDPPCSGTGTLRRHPEIRWRLKASDLPAFAARQGRILDTAASLLSPGGSLVYAVCSAEPEEGEEVIARFLGRHREFDVGNPRSWLPRSARPLLGADGAVRTFPMDAEIDGFFGVLLVRRG